MTDRIGDRLFRFVNRNDVIPRLPLGIPYWLVKRLLKKTLKESREVLLLARVVCACAVCACVVCRVRCVRCVRSAKLLWWPLRSCRTRIRFGTICCAS
jgi:hypothetical protein